MFFENSTAKSIKALQLTDNVHITHFSKLYFRELSIHLLHIYKHNTPFFPFPSPIIIIIINYYYNI